ncbi:MAG: hypothetical protein OKBPIBMD_01578 [Chlorobi bacterium]|nr:MAG: hypothetical protein F9K28_05545 [Bacteroidota bacterium]MBV6464126.1 hypothetical protein [Chlorobiota bacterium]MBW7852852.1 hypothetical protein [Candidatus Kapabacteria bacterium]MCC6330917.1 hypothetical protein [Ignavibacteria bacterium]MBZ0193790.1 hypothetical protein [Candidatus Kapabacteria bacterium]
MCSKFWVIPILLAVLSVTLHAQLQLLYPADNSYGVECQPLITIRAPAAIEPASVTMNYPDGSVMGGVQICPTVLLVDDNWSDDTPLTQIRHTVMGTYSLKDPQTLQFKPYRLLPGKTYRIKVSGLWLKGQPAGQMPDLEATFSTVSETPFVQWSSINHTGYIGCTEAIYIRVKSMPVRGLEFAQRVISVSTNHTENNFDEPLPFNLEIKNDSIVIKPAGQWPIGAVLTLTGSLSTITGNPDDDVKYRTVVRSAATMKVSASASSGSEIPAEIQDVFTAMSRVVRVGETVQIHTPRDLPNRWRVVKWQSSYADVEEMDDPSFQVDCSELQRDIFLTALLEKLDSLNVVVKIDSGGRVRIHDSSGVQISELTESDTIYITDDNPLFRMVAVSKDGYEFVDWKVIWSDTTTLLGSSIKFGDNTQNGKKKFSSVPWWALRPGVGVTLVPNFEKVNPADAQYCLQARIANQDDDEGWDLNEVVSFTTERTICTSSPQLESICITTNPCWEIVGYYDNERNDYVFLDEPTDEYCASAVTTWPANMLTFFVQRRRVSLRVDKVLLSRDDPTDMIPDAQFNANTKITVKVRLILNGKVSWPTLTTITCKDGNIQYSPYSLRCGDVVKLIVSESPVRGQKWIGFAELEKYVLPEQTDTQPITYTFEINGQQALFEESTCNVVASGYPEIRIRGLYRQGFGVEKIGCRLRVLTGKNRNAWKWEERWLDPEVYRDQFDDEPVNSRQIEYEPSRGINVKIRFTLPVNQQTVYDGSIKMRSFDNFLCSNPAETNLDFSTTSQYGNTDFISSPYESPRTVSLWVMDPNSSPILQALHTGQVDILCTTDTKALGGITMESAFHFQMSDVEMPAYQITFEKIKFDYDGDFDFVFSNSGDTYHVTMGGIIGSNGFVDVDEAFRRIPDCSEQQGIPPGECTIPYSDNDGIVRMSGNGLITQPNWMARGDVVWWYISSYDEDCKDENDCFVNRVHDFLEEVKDEAKSYSDSKKESNEKIIAKLIGLATSFVSALLPADEQDEHIGTGDFRGYGDTLWNGRRATELFEIGSENASYWLKPQLVLHRAVVR